MLLGKIALSVAALLVFGLDWYSSYREIKGLTTDVMLKVISVISVLCTLGVVGSLAFIWGM